MSNFYKNLSAVKKRGMDIERFISPHLSPQGVMTGKTEVFTTRTGHISARCNGILLHSSYDPIRDGNRFAETSEIKSGDTVLLYGFGLGYHVDSILKAVGENGNLLVLELNREILSLAFVSRDISDILSQSNLWIITGSNELEVSTAFSRYASEKWDYLPDAQKKVAIFLPSFKLIPSSPPLLKGAWHGAPIRWMGHSGWVGGFEGIKNAFKMLQVERRFPVLFGDIERRNFRLNRDEILKSDGIKGFFGKFKGMAGILISSGPSLDPALPELKNLSESAVIMAVDSALNALIKNGIKPDFAISIDPQDFSYIHLVDYFETDTSHRCTNIPLIILPTSNPIVVKNYKGKKYVAQKNREWVNRRKGETEMSPLPRFSDSPLPDFGYTEGGGSVSCIALDLLIKFGANPIIFVGQDCAFPGKRFYSNAVAEGERWLDLINGSYVLRDIHRDKIMEQRAVYIKDRFGLQVQTHENLNRYIRYIEEMVERERDISFYNLNSKGAGFRGVEDIPSLALCRVKI
ncbi:MAG: 6-hydroxymethylpterin diphosphokinase MptE-like protein [Nitrospinota bacterium]